MLGHYVGSFVEVVLNAIFHKYTNKTFADKIGSSVSFIVHECIIEPLVDSLTWKTVSRALFEVRLENIAVSAFSSLLLSKFIGHHFNLDNIWFVSLVSAVGTHLGDYVCENSEEIHFFYQSFTSTNYDSFS